MKYVDHGYDKITKQIWKKETAEISLINKILK